MSARAAPVGGKILSPAILVFLGVFAVAMAIILVRFLYGLGATTAMNDGFPWGLWIAFDVVIGTALACGGYAMALVVYVLNKGRYHPLVRPAILTSFLGYSAAGVAVVFDVGRYWLLWKVPSMPWVWNGNSVLLEVALCIMAYIFVLLIELSPALLEKCEGSARPRLASVSRSALRVLDRALPFIIALGFLLPTMHQSSLGSVLIVAGTKIHPLWHTALLPLLFLLTAFSIGYAVVYVESIFSSVSLGRKLETGLLSRLGRFVAGVMLAFVAVRFVGLIAAGRLGLTMTSGWRSAFFWAEILLFLAAAGLFIRQSATASARMQLQAALLGLAGAVLYRMDAYLVAFDPGQGWTYFPSVGEILVSLGLVAGEIVVYVFMVKRFPILAGAPSVNARSEPAHLKEGVVA
jgi:Ni/Fe-hydrogenase subunit HybB-like protein